MRHTGCDTAFGDLVEGHAVSRLNIHAEHLRQMPGNRFSLAVRVGGKDHAVALRRHLPQLADQRRFAGNIGIARLEAVLHIHAEQRTRQVADMPHRRRDRIAVPQIFLHRLGLRRGLQYNQFCHIA